MGNFKKVERPVLAAPPKGTFRQEQRPEVQVPAEGSWRDVSVPFDPNSFRQDRVEKWNEVNEWRKEMGLEPLPHTWMFGRNREFNPKYMYEQQVYKNWGITQRTEAWKETSRKLRRRNRVFGPASFSSSRSRKSHKRSLFRRRGKTSLIQRTLQTNSLSGSGLTIPK